MRNESQSLENRFLKRRANVYDDDDTNVNCGGGKNLRLLSCLEIMTTSSDKKLSATSIMSIEHTINGIDDNMCLTVPSNSLHIIGFQLNY